MIYSRESVLFSKNDSGIAHLVFDRKNESVNKFDRFAVEEMTAALEKLEAEVGVTGLLISSNKVNL